MERAGDKMIHQRNVRYFLVHHNNSHAFQPES